MTVAVAHASDRRGLVGSLGVGVEHLHQRPHRRIAAITRRLGALRETAPGAALVQALTAAPGPARPSWPFGPMPVTGQGPGAGRRITWIQ